MIRILLAASALLCSSFFVYSADAAPRRAASYSACSAQGQIYRPSQRRCGSRSELRRSVRRGRAKPTTARKFIRATARAARAQRMAQVRAARLPARVVPEPKHPVPSLQCNKECRDLLEQEKLKRESAELARWAESNRRRILETTP